MKILVGYVNLHPRVHWAISQYAPKAELVYMEKPTDYWNAIADRWNGKESLVIIEQDNEIHAGVIESFAKCRQPWCSYWYAGPPIDDATPKRLDDALGCTKFSARLQRKIPAEVIATRGVQLWDTIDGKVAKEARKHGFNPHVHGQVRHHHSYEVIYLPSPSNFYVRYTWQHVDRGLYPSYQPGGERYSPKPKFPEDADRKIIDCSFML